MISRRQRGITAIAVVVIGAGTLAACNRGQRGGDTATFCADVQDNIDYLRFSDFQNLEQVDTVINLFKEVGRSAPLDIEADWSALVLNLETALNNDLNDSGQDEEIYSRAYATELSAVTVVNWLHDNCGVELGPVVTIVSHDPLAPASTPPTTDQS